MTTRPMSVLLILGRVACCPLVSHVEYAPRALLINKVRIKMGQTDGRRTVTLRLPLDARSA